MKLPIDRDVGILEGFAPTAGGVALFGRPSGDPRAGSPPARLRSI